MGAWPARWRVALRIARRDAWRHKGRTTLVVAMLALPVAVVVLTTLVVRSQYPSDATYLQQHLGSSLQAKLSSAPHCVARQDVRASRDDACATGADIEPASLDQLSAIVPAADTVEPATFVFVTVIEGDRARETAVTTVGPKTLAALGKPLAGRLPTQPDEIALPEDVALTINAGVGDRVTLSSGRDRHEEATVVALVPTEASFGALMVSTDLATVMASPNLQAMYVSGPQPITWDAVQEFNRRGYTVLSRDVIEHPPAGGALPTPGPYAFLSDEASPVAVVVIGVVLLEVVLIVGPAFAVGARRSRRQLALVAVSGGSAADLRRVVRAGGVVQGVVAGVVGGVAGLALGGALLATVLEADVADLSLPWWEWATAVVATTGLGVCAAALPSRAAGRADPLSALAGAPEPPPARHRKLLVPAVGALAAVVCALGFVVHQPIVALLGALGIEAALVFAGGPLVGLLARLGAALRLIPRLALRDAARQRTRTSPALAAVVVCVTGAVLALTYSNASAHAVESERESPFASGLIALRSDVASPSETRVDEAARSLEQRVPGLETIPVRVAAPVTKDGTAFVRPAIDASLCNKPAPADLAEACGRFMGGRVGMFDWTVALSQDSQASILVDDGTMIAANGLDGAVGAARALREGRALVNTPLALDRNGNVVVENYTGSATTPERTTIPGYVVSWSDLSYELVLPAQTLDELGLKAIPAGYLAVPAQPLTSVQRAEVEAVLAGHGLVGEIFADPDDDTGFLLLLAAVATVLAAAVSWVAVGLAAVDSLPDLATLAAVGAAPSARRWLAGAQAGVITVVGAILGAVGGLVLAAAMVWYQGQQPGIAEWSLHLQWGPLALLVVGVPLVAVAGAALVTRPRQVAVRRVA